MATGFHPATVAFSVRNRLAVTGPTGVAELTAGLQERWLSTIDEVEVREALAALESRALVRRVDDDRFAVVHREIFQHRGKAGDQALAVHDPKAWEGWR